MNIHLASHLRKIQLSRSEPVISLNKVRRGSAENKYITRHIANKESPLSAINNGTWQPHPPACSRPNLTVISPKRHVRVPVESLYDLRRSSADGESSQYSDDEQSSDDMKMLKSPRLPGDGCNSSSDTDSVDSMDDNDVFNVQDELDYIGEDQGDEFVEIETDVESDIEYLDEEVSVSSSFNTEGTLSALGSSPTLRLQFSKCSLKDSSPLPLLQSLFLNVPPTLYFTVEGEEISQLPIEVRKILKWKQSTVTPKVVKSCIARSGFRITKKNGDWLGVWGKHMKSLAFKGVKVHQKVNHFPGSFHIGRKDKLWKGFLKMKIAYGKKEFYFLPQSFILPQDTISLRKAWDESVGRTKWIVKPPASARGSGIRVISKWGQIPKKRAVVVQKYVAKPYLINGRKFDLRIYVFVACYDPLRVYIFQDGLVRFATKKYSSSSKSLSNKFIHLTNYSINKRNVDVYTTTDNAQDGQETHKWSIKYLWTFLRKEGTNTRKIWELIKDISVKAILCGDSAVNLNIKQNLKNRHSCYELFGLDILLDHNLKPWLLEVNISPSLHSNSDLDKTIKGQLVKDILNMAGFYLPKHLLLAVPGASSNVNEFGADSFWLNQGTLSADEKAKHMYYVQRHQDLVMRGTILDILTPDDLLMLMETEDELSRCGEFERLMPTTDEKPYLNFLENPRYYNMLLAEWTKQYLRNATGPGLGTSLLQTYATKGIHLQQGSNVSRHHVWNLSEQGKSSPTRSVALKSRSFPTRVTSSTTSSKAAFPALQRKKKNGSSSSYSYNKDARKEKKVNSLMTYKFPSSFNTIALNRKNALKQVEGRKS